MKKEKVKIQVLRQMTEGDIKNLGGNLWIRRRAIMHILVGGLLFLWMVVVSYNTEPNRWLPFVLAVVPVIVVFVIWAVRFGKAGEKLWNEVKDKEQPIDLG